MAIRAATRSLAVPLAGLVLALGAVVGCGGGEGAKTDCGLDGCTITFPREGAPAVSILGIGARLVGVENGVATIEVAGHPVTVPIGGQAESGGFNVRVERVTDAEVVVRIER